MDRRRDLVTAFVAALLLHAVAAVFAGSLLAGRQDQSLMIPAFAAGDSGLSFTLLMPNVRTPEQPQSADGELAVVLTEPEPVGQPPAPVQPQVSTVQKVEPQKETPEQPDTNDADTLRKGVEGSAYPASGIRPVYPLGSRIRGEEGLVTVHVLVDRSGRVKSVAVTQSSGYFGLDEAVVKAVRMTKFIPAQRGEIPHEGETTLTVRFQLREGRP